jgi:hypothetical protein
MNNKRTAWNCPICHATNVTPVCGCNRPHITTTVEALNAIELTLPARPVRKGWRLKG